MSKHIQRLIFTGETSISDNLKWRVNEVYDIEEDKQISDETQQNIIQTNTSYLRL